MPGTTGNSPQMYDWLMKSGRDRNTSDLKTDRTGPPGPQIVGRGGHRGEERRGGDLPHTLDCSASLPHSWFLRYPQVMVT